MMKEEEEEGTETKHSGCVVVWLCKTRVSKCIEHNFLALDCQKSEIVAG